MSTPLFFSTLTLVTAGLPNEARRTQAEDGQLSWQSAFWALVSIAIGAAAQPSGSILGMPPRWGFALKCSPVICLFNALETLLCIRIQWRPRPKLIMVTQKYTLQSTQSAVEAPAATENNTAIRVASFALGPVMSATKLFACSGLVYTKILAGCYLASFVCDEVVLNLVWLSRRGGIDVAAPSLMATALSFVSFSNEGQAADPSTPPLPITQQTPAMSPSSPDPDRSRLKDLADMAVLASIIFIAYFVSDVIFIIFYLEPNLLDWLDTLVALVGIAIYAILAVIKKYRREGLAATLIWELLLRWCLGGFAMGLLFGILRKGATVVSTTPSGALALYAEGVPSLVVLAGHVDVVALLLIGGLRVAHVLLGTYRITFLGDALPGTNREPSESSQTRLKLLGGGWFVLHFIVALLMYYFTFDPDRTAKPAWTDVLG